MADLDTTRFALQVTGGEEGAARRPLKSVWGGDRSLVVTVGYLIRSCDNVSPENESER